MKLLNLTLHNFKGIREFSLHADGADVAVRGTNATGKTTLADAFTWLLFDKDSEGAKAFEIKTINKKTGEPLHKLEHSVEGVFDLGGKAMTLKKVYAEKWSKKRGSAKEEFSGHNTTYYIDGVPTQAGEYKEQIKAICDEDLFRLLSDPLYFAAGMHWTKRRQMLLEVCGDVADEDVLAANPELEPLRVVMAKRKLDDHKKVVMAERKRVNEELQKLPVRIDEVSRSLPVLDQDPDAFVAGIDRQRADLWAKADGLRQEIMRLESGGQVPEIRKQIAEHEAEILRLENERKEAFGPLLDEHRKRLRAAEDVLSVAEQEERTNRRLRDESMAEAARIRQQCDRLREQWNVTDALEFKEPDDPKFCPVCKQSFPQERIEAVRNNALLEFNARKAHDLEQITADGKRLRAEAQKYEDDAKAGEIKGLELQKAVAIAREELDRIFAAKPKEPAQSPRVAELRHKTLELVAQIDDLSHTIHDQVSARRVQVLDVEQQVRELEQERGKVEQLRQGQARIAELEEEEKRLAAEFERLERDLFLIEQFIRSKVSLLEGRINARFEFVRFQLFREQINGGVDEVCEMSIDGVPYSSLNNAARIQGGLDVIRTLSEHHGFCPPIWIDNRESVVSIPAMRAQVISLYVDENAKALEVQVEAPAEMAA